MKILFKLVLSLSLVTFLPGSLMSTETALAQTPAAPNSGASVGSSYNWAGYTATGGTFTAVSGNWVIPSTTTSGSVSADAEWIGIGGISSNDLIQVGTQTIFNNGQATYQAWYETLPSASQNIAIAVKPGDFINASLSQQQTGQWAITLIDTTTKQNFSTVIPYSSSLSSAEWIEEMPTAVGSGFIPLDNFGASQIFQRFSHQERFVLKLKRPRCPID